MTAARGQTFGVREEGRHAGLYEDGLVLQESAHEAAGGQLTQQVDQQLSKALAVEQPLPVQARVAPRSVGGGHLRGDH